MLSSKAVLPLLLLLLFAPIGAYSARQITIVNNCPTPIPIFINGAAQAADIAAEADYPSLAPGQSISRTFEDSWDGLVYSNANAPGSPGNSGIGTTRVGFINQPGYYYIVKDPTSFNTGVQIVPDTPAGGGFCSRLTCNSQYCANTQERPVVNYPVPGAASPLPPLYRCPGTGGYTVRFCPTGTFPRTDETMRLHPNGDSSRCMEALGTSQNGTLIQVSGCTDAPSQRWRFLGNPVSGGGGAQVELVGTGLCLDASTVQQDYTPLKLWACIPNLRAQTWTYTPRSQLVITAAGQCVDLSGAAVQTMSCVTGVQRQIWTVS